MSSYDPLFDYPTVTPKRSRPWHLVLAIGAGAILTVGLIGGTYYFTRPAATDNRQTVESSPSLIETNARSSTSPVPSRKPVLSPPDPSPEDAEKTPDTAPDVKPSPRISDIPNDAVVVLNRRIHIGPQSYFAQEFKVANNAHLQGTFDSSSPVELSVTTRQGSELYHSARINKGSMDVKLQPGNYYLIIENRFSWITGKDVLAVIYIQYY